MGYREKKTKNKRPYFSSNSHHYFIMFRYLILILLFVVTACSSEKTSPENAPVPEGSLSQQIQFLVDNNRFDEALDKLRKEDASETRIIVMIRDTHLLYGNWLMYHAETIHMTERMPKALRHFRRVLEIDPNNRTARSNIEQIEAIYAQLGRPVPEGVAE
jgi:tetratricopeptide (TPR) repeat protein